MICLDEFGPLERRPYAGANWAPPGRPHRLPATYHRPYGVRHLLAAYDLRDDKLFAHVKRYKGSAEVLEFLRYLRRRVPAHETLYVVLDNFSPHHHRRVKEWAAQNGVQLIYTPTYASWLNRIECHFGPLRTFALKNTFYPSPSEMARAIRRYIRWRNRHTDDPGVIKEQNKIKVA